MENEEKVKKYLEEGIRPNFTLKQLKEFIEANPIEFNGEECGLLRFDKSNSGRRYIEIVTKRCYLD